MAYRLNLRHVFRHFSSNTSTPLTSKEKTRDALLLIKSETNPESILEICRSASLIPVTHHHRAVLSVAVTKLSEANHFDGIREFLDELFQTRPDLNNERFISHAIVLYGHANMLPHALRTFSHMREELHITPSANSLNALLHASIIAKDYKEEVSRSSNSENVSMVLSLRELLPANPMELSVFNGEDDAYGWVLDTDKFFAETGISSTSKLLIAVSTLQGPPLKWWLQWSPHHPMASWESFIPPFLWHFKPEWQHLLPSPEEPTEVTSYPLIPAFLQAPIVVSDLEFDSQSVTNFALDSFTVSDPDDFVSATHGSLSLIPISILKEEQSPLTEELMAERFVPPPRHSNHVVVVNPPLPQTPPKPADRHCRVVTDTPDPSFASNGSTMPPPPPAPPDHQWHTSTIAEENVLCVIPTNRYTSETNRPQEEQSCLLSLKPPDMGAALTSSLKLSSSPSLIDFYSKYCYSTSTRHLFDEMPERNTARFFAAGVSRIISIPYDPGPLVTKEIDTSAEVCLMFRYGARCRYPSHARLNNPTKSPLPKQPDWNLSEVEHPPPPPEPPDLYCIRVGEYCNIGSCWSRLTQNHGFFLLPNNTSFAFQFLTILDVSLFIMIFIHLSPYKVAEIVNRSLLVRNSNIIVFGLIGKAQFGCEIGVGWVTNIVGQKLRVKDLLNLQNMVLIIINWPPIWKEFSHSMDTLLSCQAFVVGMNINSVFSYMYLLHYLVHVAAGWFLFANFETPKIDGSLSGEGRGSPTNFPSLVSQSKLESKCVSIMCVTTTNLTKALMSSKWEGILTSTCVSPFFNLNVTMFVAVVPFGGSPLELGKIISTHVLVGLNFQAALALGCEDFTNIHVREKRNMCGFTMKGLNFIVLVCCLIYSVTLSSYHQLSIVKGAWNLTSTLIMGSPLEHLISHLLTNIGSYLIPLVEYKNLIPSPVFFFSTIPTMIPQWLEFLLIEMSNVYVNNVAMCPSWLLSQVQVVKKIGCSHEFECSEGMEYLLGPSHGIFIHEENFYNLEDKVDFDGVGNDMILEVKEIMTLYDSFSIF